MTQDAEQTNVQIETNVDLENSETGERESPQERKLKAEFNAKYVDIFVWAFEIPQEKAKQTGAANGEKKEMTVDSFCEELTMAGWEKRELSYGHEPDFSVLQYFNASTRQILPIKGERVRQNQSRWFTYFKDDANYENWKYHVKKGNKEFNWPVLSVDLQIYPSGVGLLLIEVCSNEERVDRKAGEDQKTGEEAEKVGEDALFFNDYGRRISMPFIPPFVDDKIDVGICPNEIGIQLDSRDENEKNEFVRSFEEEIICYRNAKEPERENKLAQPAPFLKALIAHAIPPFKKEEKTFDEKILRETVGFSDDRMFLIALYRDDAKSETLRDGYRFYDETFNKWLYALVFVDDTPASPSCADRQTMLQNFKDVLYCRWLERGTIYASTNFSTVCLTSEKSEIDDSVVKPFLYHYAYMSCLVYSQRLALLLFERQIQDLATELAEFDENEKSKDKEKLENTLNFYRDYAGFNASYMLTEFSPQIQGIEFYRLLQESLLIASEKKELEQTLEALRDVAKARSDKIAQKEREDAEKSREDFRNDAENARQRIQTRLEKMAICLGIAAGVVPIFFQQVPGFIGSFSDDHPILYAHLWFLLPFVLIPLVYYIFLWIIEKYMQKFHGDKNEKM